MNKKTKKTIFYSGVGIVILLIILFLINLNQNNKQTTAEELASDTDLAIQDSDGDGIPDWRELLIGTNPLMADTTGDGVRDEVIEQSILFLNLSRELGILREEYPDVSEDELLAIYQATRENEQNSSNNLTDKMAREAFIAGQMLTTLGQWTPEMTDQATENFVNQNLYNYSYDLVANVEISTIDDFDINQEANYINTINGIITTPFFEPDPFVLIQNAVTDENPNPLEKGLLQNLSRLRSATNKLKAMSVPTYFIDIHTEITNALIRIETDLAEVSNFFNDPMRGYIAIFRYSGNVTNYGEVLEITSNIFQKRLNELSQILENTLPANTLGE